jgi:hypothetical protein
MARVNDDQRDHYASEGAFKERLQRRSGFENDRDEYQSGAQFNQWIGDWNSRSASAAAPAEQSETEERNVVEGLDRRAASPAMGSWEDYRFAARDAVDYHIEETAENKSKDEGGNGVK